MKVGSRQGQPLNYQPTNINQLIKLLQREENNSDIILELFVPKMGMTVQGEEFPELPVSMLSVMSTPHAIWRKWAYSWHNAALGKGLPRPMWSLAADSLRFTVDRNAP